MNKSASTLSIRLQLPGEEETEKPARQEEVVYLWDRIIIAFIVAALIVIAVAVGAWRWLQDPAPSAPAPSLMAHTQAAAPVPLPTADTSATPLASETSSEQAPNARISTNKSLSQTNKSVSQTNMSLGQTDKSLSQNVSIKASEQATTKQTPTLAIADASPDKPAATREAAPINRRLSSPTLTQPGSALAKVEILSDHLVRAQLTNGMLDREPVDHAQAVIPMNDEGLVKVYFFTELQDLQGQIVFYDWFLEDKRMARVRARPQLDSANAYSSKFIDRYMVGQWQVKVQTEQGDTLARAEFEVR